MGRPTPHADGSTTCPVLAALVQLVACCGLWARLQGSGQEQAKAASARAAMQERLAEREQYE